MSTIEFDALLEQGSAAFMDAAIEHALVEVAFARVATPIGELLVAATELGIVRVAFDIEDFDLVLEQLATTVSPRLLEVATPPLDDARSQLEEYFAGTRAGFALPLDLRLTRGPFRREVLALLESIPVGETRSYAELAIQAGRPTAVRAVGSGCATNPVPIIVPCHRVLRTGGELGGYLGGVSRKRWLLDHERRMAS